MNNYRSWGGLLLLTSFCLCKPYVKEGKLLLSQETVPMMLLHFMRSVTFFGCIPLTENHIYFTVNTFEHYVMEHPYMIGMTCINFSR